MEEHQEAQILSPTPAGEAEQSNVSLRLNIDFTKRMVGILYLLKKTTETVDLNFSRDGVLSLSLWGAVSKRAGSGYQLWLTSRRATNMILMDNVVAEGVWLSVTGSQLVDMYRNLYKKLCENDIEKDCYTNVSYRDQTQQRTDPMLEKNFKHVVPQGMTLAVVSAPSFSQALNTMQETLRRHAGMSGKNDLYLHIRTTPNEQYVRLSNSSASKLFVSVAIDMVFPVCQTPTCRENLVLKLPQLLPIKDLFAYDSKHRNELFILINWQDSKTTIVKLFDRDDDEHVTLEMKHLELTV